jgi:hypothetical protein
MHSYFSYFTNPANHQRSQHNTSRITDCLQHGLVGYCSTGYYSEKRVGLSQIKTTRRDEGKKKKSSNPSHHLVRCVTVGVHTERRTNRLIVLTSFRSLFVPKHIFRFSCARRQNFKIYFNFRTKFTIVYVL